jgi:hypothetical protein
MPSPYLAQDIQTADIDTVRGANADSWYFDFYTSDDATHLGRIYDNENYFTDDAASGSAKALKINVVSASENRAVQDMDFIDLTIDGSGLRVWLPAITGGGSTSLYVDLDGNTWYDAALTSPAGGVGTVSDAITLAEDDFDATDFVADTITPEDAIDAYSEYSSDLNDSVSIEDTITEALLILNTYLNDSISLSDSIVEEFKAMTDYLNDSVLLSDAISYVVEDNSVFDEEEQTDLTWIEET